MAERHKGFGKIAAGALLALLPIFAAPNANSEQVAQCHIWCEENDIDTLNVPHCLVYNTFCETVAEFIQSTARATCGAPCQRRLKSTYDSRNGRVTITKLGRARGITPANASTFHPPGAVVQPFPGFASLRASASGTRTAGVNAPVNPHNKPTGSGNKLTEASKVVTPPPASATGPGTATPLKKH